MSRKLRIVHHGMEPEKRKRIYSRACYVEETPDRITITTNARRSQAILMVLAGATLQETGDQFGVSRERVRQWMVAAGLNQSMRMLFGAEPTLGTKKYERALANRRRRNRGHAIRARLCVHLIQDHVLDVGRVPTYSELWALISGKSRGNYSGATSELASYLGVCPRRGKKYWRRVQALYRLAGYQPRPRGEKGHAAPFVWTPARLAYRERGRASQGAA